MSACDWSSLARTASLAALLAVGTAGAAYAQSPFSVRGNVGASFVQSPEAASTLFNSGTNLGLGAELRVYRGVGLTAEVSYDTFTLNEDNARIYSQSGGDPSFLGGSLGLRYTFLNSTDAHPYIAVGGGYYQLRITDRKQVTEDRQLVDVGDQARVTEEGGYLAAGALFRVNETYAVFAEPRYTFFDFGQGLGGALRYFTMRLGVDVRL